MAYRAIYRKWRPLTFEDVVGQNHITDTLKTELVTDKVAHAYLFCGTRGTGKTSTAKILSRAVNCESLTKNGNPCNECESCRGILGGTIMDVIEIDAASNNGVDNIRELRDEIIYTPANVKYKVYIIDEVHMLSSGAFNALLKTLEEPPPHAIFILATTEPHKIPATIQSRCQRFDFRRISSRHIAGRIGEITRKDGISISQDAIALVASLGDGSMRDALSILDLCGGISGEITKTDIESIAGVASGDVLFDIVSAIISSDVSKAVSVTDTAISSGNDITNLTESLLGFFREILICKTAGNAAEILDKSDEALERLKTLADIAGEEMLIHAIHLLSDSVSVCKWAASPRVILETSIIKLCKPELDGTSEAFAARIKRLEAALTLGTPINTNTEQPPKKAEKDPVPPPPLPVEETIVEKTPDIAEDVNIETEKTQIPTDDEKWMGAVAAIKQTDVGTGSLLDNTKSFMHGDSFYIVFTNDVIKNLASESKPLKDILKNFAKGLNIKFVTQDELDSRKKADSDPLDELISKKDELGDQMTIF